jgi:predicted nucleic acid-binding protein
MAEAVHEVDRRNALVLDANILLRAVLGSRVQMLIERYVERVSLFIPPSCVLDARKYLPVLCAKRGWDLRAYSDTLDRLLSAISVAEPELFAPFEWEAKQRIGDTDVEDWPVVALALALRAPVWTEDRDFFGAGVATWCTSTVELYLSEGRGLMLHDSVREADMWPLTVEDPPTESSLT